MLFVCKKVVRLHLASIRKTVRVHRSIEILYTLYKVKETSLSCLNLTVRGKEVFKLILRGYTIEKIGLELGMGYNGVRRHIEKMILANNCSSMRKLVGKYYAKA